VSIRTSSCALVISLVIIAFTAAGLAAPQSQTPANPVPTLVPVAVLQTLLPAPTGWTRKSEKASQISLSSTCDYTFAAAVFEKGQMRIKVTLADSGRTEESLSILASMVMSLPDGYTDTVPPASTVRRLKIAGAPAAELWDSAKNEGEITVVVNGRFVAMLEGFQLDSVDTLHTIVEQIDMKKVAALK
jgi:hypothetical protein